MGAVFQGAELVGGCGGGDGGGGGGGDGVGGSRGGRGGRDGRGLPISAQILWVIDVAILVDLRHSREGVGWGS